MSVRKLTVALILAFASLSGNALVQAQEHVPVADPFEFDPDFRWFEPMTQLDFEDMKPSKRANTGFFATYDRLKLYGSRPEVNDPNATFDGLDDGWGHRYEFGYMLDNDHGWLASWTSNEVAEASVLRRESLNRLNQFELDGTGANTALTPPLGFVFPFSEQNNLGFFERFYDVTDSENFVEYDSYELNKTWRLQPHRYGGILEPMIGFRYMQVTDSNIFQTFLSNIDPIPFTFNGQSAEQLTTNQAITDNQLIGGQIGFRYYKHRDRFTFSSDFRFFGGGSFQRSRAQTLTETVILAAGVGNVPTAVVNGQTSPVFTSNDEGFYGFDLRGEVAYQFTRALSVRGGFQLIDIASGVWRGGDAAAGPLGGGEQDQDLIQLGFSLGLTLNR